MTTSTANPIVLIPARMASQRLPGKPLADIHGVPMIVHVWRRAVEADCGPVVVVAGDEAIAEAVRAAGGDAGDAGDVIVEDGNHASGSDRNAAALARIDPEGRYDPVINLQGDMPTLNPALVRAVMEPFGQPAGEGAGSVDVTTLAAPLTDPAERDDPAVVKAVVSFADGKAIGRALYFTRAAAPWGDGPLYHHIGLYGFRRAALMRFVALSPSPLERCEKLEQLRALEAGFTIMVRQVDTAPPGVDTPHDLARVRAMMTP